MTNTFELPRVFGGRPSTCYITPPPTEKATIGLPNWSEGLVLGKSSTEHTFYVDAKAIFRFGGVKCFKNDPSHCLRIYEPIGEIPTERTMVHIFDQVVFLHDVIVDCLNPEDLEKMTGLPVSLADMAGFAYLPAGSTVPALLMISHDDGNPVLEVRSEAGGIAALNPVSLFRYLTE